LLLEQNSTEVEKDWLLTQYLPKTFKELSSLLNQCSSTLLSDSTGVFSIISKDDSVSGAFTLKGTSIVEADIIIRYSYEKKPSTHTATITGAQPYRLTQLQDSIHYITAASDELANLQPHNTDVLYHLEVIQTILNNVLKSKQAIVIPTKECFPTVVFPTTVFTPALPPEIVLEFSLLNKRMNVRGYQLFISTKPKSPAPTPTGSHAMLFRSFKYRSKFLEVVNHTSVDIEIPVFEAYFAALNQVHICCQGILDKLLVLNAVLGAS